MRRMPAYQKKKIPVQLGGVATGDPQNARMHADHIEHENVAAPDHHHVGVRQACKGTPCIVREHRIS